MAKLKLHNQKHPPAPTDDGECVFTYRDGRAVELVGNFEGEKKREDERLFEEEYTKLKGEVERKYALIPRFYAKVSCLYH